MSKPQSSTQWCSSQGRGKADKSVSLTHQASSDETSSCSNVPERLEPVVSGTHRHSDAHHSSQLAKSRGHAKRPDMQLYVPRGRRSQHQQQKVRDFQHQDNEVHQSPMEIDSISQQRKETDEIILIENIIDQSSRQASTERLTEGFRDQPKKYSITDKPLVEDSENQPMNITVVDDLRLIDESRDQLVKDIVHKSRLIKDNRDLTAEKRLIEDSRDLTAEKWSTEDLSRKNSSAKRAAEDTSKHLDVDNFLDSVPPDKHNVSSSAGDQIKTQAHSENEDFLIPINTDLAKRSRPEVQRYIPRPRRKMEEKCKESFRITEIPKNKHSQLQNDSTLQECNKTSEINTLHIRHGDYSLNPNSVSMHDCEDSPSRHKPQTVQHKRKLKCNIMHTGCKDKTLDQKFDSHCDSSNEQDSIASESDVLQHSSLPQTLVSDEVEFYKYSSVHEVTSSHFERCEVNTTKFDKCAKIDNISEYPLTISNNVGHHIMPNHAEKNTSMDASCIEGIEIFNSGKLKNDSMLKDDMLTYSGNFSQYPACSEEPQLAAVGSSDWKDTSQEYPMVEPLVSSFVADEDRPLIQDEQTIYNRYPSNTCHSEGAKKYENAIVNTFISESVATKDTNVSLSNRDDNCMHFDKKVLENTDFSMTDGIQEKIPFTEGFVYKISVSEETIDSDDDHGEVMPYQSALPGESVSDYREVTSCQISFPVESIADHDEETPCQSALPGESVSDYREVTPCQISFPVESIADHDEETPCQSSLPLESVADHDEETPCQSSLPLESVADHDEETPCQSSLPLESIAGHDEETPCQSSLPVESVADHDEETPCQSSLPLESIAGHGEETPCQSSLTEESVADLSEITPCQNLVPGESVADLDEITPYQNLMLGESIAVLVDATSCQNLVPGENAADYGEETPCQNSENVLCPNIVGDCGDANTSVQNTNPYTKHLEENKLEHTDFMSSSEEEIFPKPNNKQIQKVPSDLSTGVSMSTKESSKEPARNADQTITEEDEDSWDKLFDDNGDCLDPSLMEEITTHVGQVKIAKAKINYLEYQAKEPDMDMEVFGHVIEISNFPVEFQTRDLMAAFKNYMSRGFDIKWVDDTHALGVFASEIAARDALKMTHPMMKLCPLSEATKQSRNKARRCQEFLQPYKPRPETTAAAARRLVTGALGMAPRISKEQRDQERKQLREAKEKKQQDRKQKDDIWDGKVGKCAMDS